MATTEQAIRVGYVYIMTNPAMPGLVKIGSTTLLPDERARQLSSSTGVPRPFQVVAFHPFEDELRAEVMVVVREKTTGTQRIHGNCPTHSTRTVIGEPMREEHGIELKAMTIDAESTLDRRGTQLLEEIEVPFRPGKGEG